MALKCICQLCRRTFDPSVIVVEGVAQQHVKMVPEHDTRPGVGRLSVSESRCKGSLMVAHLFLDGEGDTSKVAA